MPSSSKAARFVVFEFIHEVSIIKKKEMWCMICCWSWLLLDLVAPKGAVFVVYRTGLSWLMP